MFENIVNAISLYAIPFIIVSIVLFGAFKKVNVYETFTDGAKDGFKTAVTIIPFLVGMLVAIGVFISWDTLLIKSFLSVSILFNSLTIELNLAVSEPSSKSFGIGSCILKLPFETSPVA